MRNKYSHITLSVIAIISLAGCGGGGGSSAPAPMINIGHVQPLNNQLNNNQQADHILLKPIQPLDKPLNHFPSQPSPTLKTYNIYRQEQILSSKLEDLKKDEDFKQKVAIIDSEFTMDDIFKDGQGKLRVKTPQGGSAGKENHFLNSHGTFVLGIFITNNKDSNVLIQSASINDADMSVTNSMFDDMYKEGARVFNNSYGNVSDKEQGTNMYDFVGNKPETDSVFVFAAGNQGVWKDNTANYASPQSLYPLLNDNARNGWIAVAAVTNDDDTKLAEYSSKIGEKAKNWGITAKGDQSVKFSNRVVSLSGGTSFATPVVTAAVTNVWNKFPWMSNHLATITVLSTANKPGTKEQTQNPDKDFGWGVLNQERALKGPGRFDKRLLTNKDQDDSLVVDFDHREYQNKDKLTWSNDIAGDAGIIKRGTGTLYLSGKNTYSGNTKIQNGTLSFSGSLKNSKVIIEDRGTFEAKSSNDMVSVSGVDKNSYIFENKGSLNIYGKGLKIDGDYKGSQNSRIVIDIHKSNLEVAGKMDMGGSRILADIENVNEVPQLSENIKKIISANSIQNYNGVYNISDRISTLIKITGLNVSDKDISVKYQRENVAKALEKYTTLSASVLNASKNLDELLNELANNPSASLTTPALTLFTMQAPALIRAVESMSAEIHSSSLNTVMLINKVFNRAISDRVYNSILLADSGFWIDGVYTDAKISQTGYTGANVDIRGSQVGFDYKLDDRTTLGISLNQSLSKSKFDKYAGKNETKSIGASIYGGYEFNNFYIASRLGYIGSKNEVNREIIDSISRVKYNSQTHTLYTEIGKNFTLNEVNANIYFANEMNRIKRDGFSEKENFGITSGDKQYTSNSFLVGARTSIKSGKFDFMANINHIYIPNPKDFGFEANYTNSSTPIYIKGISEPRNLTFLGAGFDYEIYKNLVVNLKADKTFSKNRLKNSLIKLGFRFSI